jgi:hypothetical protein
VSSTSVRASSIPTKPTSRPRRVSSWAISSAIEPPKDHPSNRIGPVGATAVTVSA